MKNRKEIELILNKEIDDKAKIEEIASLKSTKTDIARLMILTEEEIENLVIGQIIDNIGHSWTDTNVTLKDIGYQCESTKEGKKVIFRCNNVEGYKVEYLNESYFLELTDYDYDKVDELLEEVEKDTVYQDFMYLIGSDADMDNEAEILIPKSTKFKIVDIINAEEQYYYFVDLEVVE